MRKSNEQLEETAPWTGISKSMTRTKAIKRSCLTPDNTQIAGVEEYLEFHYF